VQVSKFFTDRSDKSIARGECYLPCISYEILVANVYCYLVVEPQFVHAGVTTLVHTSMGTVRLDKYKEVKVYMVCISSEAAICSAKCAVSINHVQLT
jgi:hypothetical protein